MIQQSFDHKIKIIIIYDGQMDIVCLQIWDFEEEAIMFM